MKTHQLLANVYDLNILGKYRQREEKQISEIRLKAEKLDRVFRFPRKGSGEFLFLGMRGFETTHPESSSKRPGPTGP